MISSGSAESASRWLGERRVHFSSSLPIRSLATRPSRASNWH
uniref:Uncharacterized protein n=1 Tax=Anguilla anguilla TaxID=7936 RepID=A0A0E9RH60_ANGAN